MAVKAVMLISTIKQKITSNINTSITTLIGI